MSLGMRLAEERKRIGLNQKEFSEIGRVSKTSQVNYESGERSPNADYLEAIVATNVDVQYILTGVRSANIAEINAKDDEHKPKMSHQEMVMWLYGGNDDQELIKKPELKPVEYELEEELGVYETHREKMAKMIQLMDGLTNDQQQQVITFIEEKKRLNNLENQVHKLTRTK